MSAMTEKRTWPRKDCLVPASFLLSESEETPARSGYITEISGGGLRLRSDKEFGLTRIPLTIDFILQGTEVKVKASPKWRHENIMGLEYDRPLGQNVERNIFAFVNVP